jgi:ubiquinone/menaquinone biosynthesis C-methylase UbiE
MPFDHFNLIAGIYDKAGEFRVSELVLGLLSLAQGETILDAGGGTGRVSAALRGHAREVVVADPSRGMLQRAANKGLAAICAPVESLPFSSGSFDRVIMVDAFHHVADQGQAVRELWRVIPPGGRIVIIEPDIHKNLVKIIAVAEKILLMRSHILTGEKIMALFEGLNGKISLLYDEMNCYLLAEKLTEV